MATFTPQRSTEIRDVLVEYVHDHPVRHRRPAMGAALVLTGVLVGAGVSAGAFAASTLLWPGPQQPTGQPAPHLPGSVPAPAGVIPGSPLIVLVGQPITQTFNTQTTVSLADRPESATHARVTLVPAGTTAVAVTLSFGTDPNGNNPSTSWTASDITSSANLTTSYDFPLDATVSTLYLTPSALDWVVTIQYVTQVPTDFGVNAHGQSYGVTGDPRGEPDLVAVGATNGRQGYVYRTELDAANGTTAAEGFKTPEDAVKWQEAHSGDVRRLPVYESDGETQIGEFHVGG